MVGRTRCALHGGKSTGSRGALKHGIYSSGIAPDERELWEQIEVGSLDDEIRLAKLQLIRAAKAKLDQADELETHQETAESGHGMHGPYTKTSTVRKRPDFDGAIDRLLRRVGQLEAQRAQLTGIGQEKSPREWADEIRRSLEQIEETDGADAALDTS
jgi:hypothetical protein